MDGQRSPVFLIAAAVGAVVGIILVVTLLSRPEETPKAKPSPRKTIADPSKARWSGKILVVRLGTLTEQGDQAAAKAMSDTLTDHPRIRAVRVVWRNRFAERQATYDRELRTLTFGDLRWWLEDVAEYAIHRQAARGDGLEDDSLGRMVGRMPALRRPSVVPTR